jgi:hypothetical protein
MLSIFSATLPPESRMALARMNEDRTLEARVAADTYDSVVSLLPVFFFAEKAVS